MIGEVKSRLTKELESLVGLMQPASKVVCPGQIFLRRLYKLLAVTHHYKLHYLICINRDAQAHIKWWCCFLVDWNVVSLLRSIKPVIQKYKSGAMHLAYRVVGLSGRFNGFSSLGGTLH